MTSGDTLVVANFNMHAGVDGWGRPFDVVEACRAIDADVLVLQETWRPDEGVGLARAVGDALGYQVEEASIAHASKSSTHPDPGRHWKPRVIRLDGPRVVQLDPRPEDAGRPGPAGRAAARWPHSAERERGRIGIAVLTRQTPLAVESLDLGQLRRDLARRQALRVDIEWRDTTVAIVGVHMSHLSQGSPRQFALLRDKVSERTPTVLAGDLNVWGPVAERLLPGWRRAVKGRSWPSWRPICQPDHVLIRPPLRAVGADVLRIGGSDHLPVRARLELAG